MVAVREVTYEADGRRMVGTLALPDGNDNRPAVLIGHEGPGLDEFQKGRAKQFAELGYVAFALDYHGDGESITDRDVMMGRLDGLSRDLDRLRAIGTAGLDILLNEPRALHSRVAGIGYCFGGTVVLELARMGTDLKAVVGFHPGLATIRPEDARNITAKVLVCIGAEDPIIDAKQRQVFEDEMIAGGVDWTMIVFGGTEHSFTHPFADRAGIPGIRYNSASDAKAWKAMLDLFGETLERP
jgi:dienelactone hydrolase